MRYAIAKDGIVENVVVWDGNTAYQTDGELIELADEVVGPGDLYDGVSFIRIEPEVVE